MIIPKLNIYHLIKMLLSHAENMGILPNRREATCTVITDARYVKDGGVEKNKTSNQIT